MLQLPVWTVLGVVSTLVPLATALEPIDEYMCVDEDEEICVAWLRSETVVGGCEAGAPYSWNGVEVGLVVLPDDDALDVDAGTWCYEYHQDGVDYSGVALEAQAGVGERDVYAAWYEYSYESATWSNEECFTGVILEGFDELDDPTVDAGCPTGGGPPFLPSALPLP